MKKILISVACLVFSVVLAQGQVKFGPLVGLNFSNVNVDEGADAYSSKTGLRIGVMADLAISDNFSIAPEFSLSQKGSKVDYGAFLGGEQKTNINYLQLPVNLVYHLNVLDNLGIFVDAGPYVGYAVSGKVEDTDIEFGSAEGEMKALDFGLGFGAGAEVGSLLFKLQYEMGLSNLSNVDNSKIKNTNLCVSVAYMFGN